MLKIQDIAEKEEGDEGYEDYTAYVARKDAMATKKYQIIAELGSGVLLPESENYQMKLTLGEHEFTARKCV